MLGAVEDLGQPPIMRGPDGQVTVSFWGKFLARIRYRSAAAPASEPHSLAHLDPDAWATMLLLRGDYHALSAEIDSVGGGKEAALRRAAARTALRHGGPSAIRAIEDRLKVASAGQEELGRLLIELIAAEPPGPLWSGLPFSRLESASDLVLREVREPSIQPELGRDAYRPRQKHTPHDCECGGKGWVTVPARGVRYDPGPSGRIWTMKERCPCRECGCNSARSR